MKPKTSFAIAVCILLCLTAVAEGYQISFRPGVTISEEYNDNIFLSPDNEQSDFITLVTADLLLGVTKRNNGLELTYNPGYSFYSDNSEFNSWRHELLLTAWVVATRNTRIELENAFLFSEDPALEEDVLSPITEDPLIQGDPTIRRGREPYTTNTATIRAIRQFGPSDSFFVEYSYGILNNDDPELEDITRHIPSVGMTYWFLPRWGLEIEGSLTDTEMDRSDDFREWHARLTQTYRTNRNFEVFGQYEHTAVNYSENQDDGSIDYQVFEPSLGLAYHISDDLLLSLRFGYFIEQRDGGDDASGPSGDIELTKTLRNGSIALTGSAGQENTVFNAENLGFTEFYEIGSRAEYNFLQNVIGDMAVNYRHATYEETEADREDDITEARLGLNYELRSWISARLEYAYRTLRSTLPEDEYTENRVIFHVALTKPRPYQWSR